MVDNFSEAYTQTKYISIYLDDETAEVCWTCFQLIKVINEHYPVQLYSTVHASVLLLYCLDEETELFKHVCSWAQEKTWNWGWMNSHQNRLFRLVRRAIHIA